MKLDCPVHERLFLRHKDGRRISVDVRIMPVRKDDGTMIGGVEVFCDATSSVVVESAFRQIREVADRDPLTGLANRRYLDRMLAHYLEKLERSGQPLLADHVRPGPFQANQRYLGPRDRRPGAGPVRTRSPEPVPVQRTLSPGSAAKNLSCYCRV